MKRGPLTIGAEWSSATSALNIHDQMGSEGSCLASRQNSHIRSPVHTAKKVDGLLQQRGVTVLMWPPQSPDLNIIEDVWGRMKTSLSRLCLYGKSADDLWAAVNEEWERLKCDSSFTEALYRSLPERMKAVVGGR
ncbi:hypothetical protein HPB49_000498 [Dermacentor silvarum]|uniref:Uncharacterized protein n=1 Tax=Dermacentor silvarum TaxID=543639 RepID=A0ACB8DSA4_DERSI|nr:hypothetical protein HPB49_000498 [Dermacentor silvarum]